MSCPEAARVPVNYESASSYGFGLSKFGDMQEIAETEWHTKKIHIFIYPYKHIE